MKKHVKLSICLIMSLFATSASTFAQDMNESPNIDLTKITAVEQKVVEQSIVPVSNLQKESEIKLSTPIVETPTKPSITKTRKIDLKAVIFDPDADFKAQATEENREMTKTEELEESIHEALHGEISTMSKMSKKGLLDKYLTIKPEGGIIDSMTLYTGYRGYTSNIWSGENYANTLYTEELLSPTIDGKFKDKKTSFRSMFFLQPGKPQHDFFNDFLGDQFIQYAWSKNDQVLFGYKRITNGIEGSMGPYTLPFVTRSQIDRTYNNARSLGVKAQGQHKWYNYSAEFGSAGRYFIDWFPGPEVAASFDVKPLGGTNGKYGNLIIGSAVNAGNAEGRYTVGSAYIDYEYKRLNATVEYGSAEGSNGSTGYSANHSEGFNGTIAYRLTPRLQVLARYDHFDPNKEKANDIRREYTAGINYFIKDQALRLLVNYTMYSVESGLYGSMIYVGTQVLL